MHQKICTGRKSLLRGLTHYILYIHIHTYTYIYILLYIYIYTYTYILYYIIHNIHNASPAHSTRQPTSGCSSRRRRHGHVYTDCVATESCRIVHQAPKRYIVVPNTPLWQPQCHFSLMRPCTVLLSAHVNFAFLFCSLVMWQCPHLWWRVGVVLSIAAFFVMSEGPCASLTSLKATCTNLEPNGCYVLTDSWTGKSCDQYCSDHGMRCIGAGEEQSNNCLMVAAWSCSQTKYTDGTLTSDILCHCDPSGKPYSVCPKCCKDDCFGLRAQFRDNTQDS